MRAKTICGALLFSLLVPALVQAQGTGSVAGTVTSADGQPVPSVQVSIRGTTFGTLTNATGRFRILNVPAGPHILQTASIGFSAMEQPIVVVADSTLTVDFTLQSRSTVLGKVVVVGYGTQRKEEITGAFRASPPLISSPVREGRCLAHAGRSGTRRQHASGSPRRKREIFCAVLPRARKPDSAHPRVCFPVFRDGSRRGYRAYGPHVWIGPPSTECAPQRRHPDTTRGTAAARRRSATMAIRATIPYTRPTSSTGHYRPECEGYAF